MTSMPDPSIEEMLLGSPALRVDTVDHGATWMLSRGGVLNIYGPLAPEDTRRIGAHERIRLVQLARRFAVPPATLQALDEDVLAPHPDAGLRATLNGHGAFDDLGFLEHLPRLRSLHVGGNGAVDLDPARRFVALTTLGVGAPGTSLEPLRGSETLTRFAFMERVAAVEAIATFANLEELTIGGASPARLAFLAPLPRLRSLAFSLVAPKRFEDLATLAALEEVSIWRAKKLEEAALSPLNGVARLRRVVLSELPRITSLAALTHPMVATIELENMKGLGSYASLAGLLGLETLVVRGTVTPAQLAELDALPRLREVRLFQSYLDALRPALGARPPRFRVTAI
jgi:hypothetical protein